MEVEVGGRAEQDMGRVRHQGGAGFRPMLVVEVEVGELL